MNTDHDEFRRVADRLRLAYPDIRIRKAAEGVFSDSPLESLIRGILSQNTTDVNRDRAFSALRQRYPSWNDVIAEDPEALAAVIRVTNHAYTKAQRIIAILTEIRNGHGSPTLDFFREWPTERVLAYLRHFHGVGEKTAAIVCLFALNRPVMPVDTHVYRVSQRLGWIGPATTPERAHHLLQRLIPSELVLPLHIGLWEHGRVTCRPVPRCAQCVIYEFCLFAEKTAPPPTVDEALAVLQTKRKAA